jgi:hypothetical protein
MVIGDPIESGKRVRLKTDVKCLQKKKNAQSYSQNVVMHGYQ